MSGYTNTNDSNCVHGLPPLSNKCDRCRLDRLEQHKKYQIDENRAISYHFDRITDHIALFEQRIAHLESGLEVYFKRIKEMNELNSKIEKSELKEETQNKVKRIDALESQIMVLIEVNNG